MLGRRGRPREPPSGWERFCRDQAREKLADFLEQARTYRSRDPTAAGIPDSRFASQFSAYLQDELAVRGTCGDHTNTVATGDDRSTMTMNGSATHGHAQGPRHGGYQYAQARPTRASTTSTGASKGKSWWNIFKHKWSNKAGGRGRTSSATEAAASVVLEGTVHLLDMKDPSQELSWQPCKLVLVQEQGNYQLEVFCPPKQSIPKMSLFCFLIEEIRSASALELPDSESSFVIKSQNHGEYVFDAGSMESKCRWIATLQLHSGSNADSCLLGNGHIVGTTSWPYQNGRVGYCDISSLNSSPVIPGRKISDPHSRMDGGAERGALSNGRLRRTESEDSVLCEVTSFARPSPRHSPHRGRKVRSMYVETLVVQPRPPHTSPPPVPKRGTRPRSISCSSHPSPSHVGTVPSSRGTHQRKLSQPCIETEPPSSPPVFHDTPTPGSLDNVSASSSSSALHPVSLAAIQQRSKGTSGSSKNGIPSPLLLPDPSQGLSNGVDVPSRFRRKISAPVGPTSPPHLTEEALRQREARVMEVEHRREKYPSADGLNAGNLLGVDYSTTVGSSTTIPSHIRSHSDGTGRTSNAGDSDHSAARRGESGIIETHPRRKFETESVSTDPRQDTPPTPYSPGSSSSESDVERRSTSTGGNPIYVETTEAEGYNQPVTHTHHPYESWATNQQDVENLRNLAQYPWFHGMISRANASQLVLDVDQDATGRYLVRQSESREGDFVLTFNYHNRAKHLRMTIDGVGCNIQHLWFDDVPSMLEYFKSSSIPLESFWLNDDVKLTTFVDRRASNTFRTTTVLNIDRLCRNPPRRSHSLHLSMAHAVANGIPSSPTDSQSTMSQGSSSHSLPQSTRNTIGWRQVVRTQRSSSAGNVGRIERRHSTNAGSILDARSNGSRGRPHPNTPDNNYVYRY